MSAINAAHRHLADCCARAKLAVFQLKENTRRNASTSEKGYDSYGPSVHRNSVGERTVKFSSTSTDSNDSSVRSILKPGEEEKEKEQDGVCVYRWIDKSVRACLTICPCHPRAHSDVVGDMPTSRLFGLRARTHAPVRSSPLVHSLTPPETEESTTTASEESRSPLPRTPSSRSDYLASTTKRGLLDIPKLVHKNSEASSLSMYSTQSGEEHQQLVPPSLIMAALNRPDPQRPLVNRQSLVPSAVDEYSELNRLSHISAGSAHLQQPDDLADPPTGPVGYAK